MEDPFPDLNLIPTALLNPKLEPKSEPSDHHQLVGAAASSSSSATAIIPSADEEALFAEYLRLASLFLTTYGSAAGTSNAPTTTTTTNNNNNNGGVAAAAKKRKPRSAELVRVSVLPHGDALYSRHLVRRTRITFDSLRLLLLREGGRADLKAAALMTDRNLWLNRDKRIVGPIPGVSVGDAFFFRMELCVLGLHGQVQAGIDYVPASRSASGEPVATSIIVSGGYEDDDDAGDVLVYTGHGGRERNVLRHSVHQKLEGGNLALERSMSYGIEIRVVRGIKSDRSPSSRIYIYDGLYKIVHCWSEAGKSGFSVYKYKLVRIEGQEEMGSTVLKFAKDLKINPLIVRPRGYLSLDISMGKENFPVSLFNDIDGECEPLRFEYVATPAYPDFLLRGKLRYFGDGSGRGGCGCTSNCSVNCYCAKLNAGDFAYDANGVLLRGKPLIYECGPFCWCPPSCPNRVSQKGVRHPLEIFRSRETGWGVRSPDLIRAGTFVCEFSGALLTRQQSELASMNGGNLVCPNRFPGRWMEWGDISDVFSDYLPPGLPQLPGLSFSIDVSLKRNVACYLSHSCSPNVFVQYVLFDHYNVSYPHLMIFAMENIPPLRDLSIDYGVVDEWVGRLTL